MTDISKTGKTATNAAVSEETKKSASQILAEKAEKMESMRIAYEAEQAEFDSLNKKLGLVALVENLTADFQAVITLGDRDLIKAGIFEMLKVHFPESVKSFEAVKLYLPDVAVMPVTAKRSGGNGGTRSAKPDGTETKKAIVIRMLANPVKAEEIGAEIFKFYPADGLEKCNRLATGYIAKLKAVKNADGLYTYTAPVETAPVNGESK